MSKEKLQELLKITNSYNWSVSQDSYLICPHGYKVEMDGKCPKGCPSPARRTGLI